MVINLYSLLKVSLKALTEAQTALNSFLSTLLVFRGGRRSLDTRGRTLRNSNRLWLVVVRVSRSRGDGGGRVWPRGLRDFINPSAELPLLLSAFCFSPPPTLRAPLQLRACVSNHVDDWPVRGLTAPLSWKMNGFSCAVFASDSKALWVVQHPRQNATVSPVQLYM